MRIEQELFFWTGGIFCNSVEQAFHRAYKSIEGAKLTPVVRAHAKKSSEALSLGKTSTEEFCRHMTEVAEVQGGPVVLEEAILKCLAVDEGMLESIKGLEENLLRQLIVDLPREWTARFEGFRNLIAHFDRVITLEECGLDSMLPSVIEFIRKQTRVALQQCVVLDSDLKRCIACINNRLPAAVIIDKFHFDREFLLRGLIRQEYTMHKNPLA